ncbi:MAG: hypothetical protein ACFFCS_01070 [Candidatus Hodarchaeota archaeon]
MTDYRCGRCKNWFDTQPRLKRRDGTYICDECAKYFVKCKKCGNFFHEEDMLEAFNEVIKNKEWWCRACTRKKHRGRIKPNIISRKIISRKRFATQIGAAAVVLDFALAFVIYIHLRDTYGFHLIPFLTDLFSDRFLDTITTWIGPEGYLKPFDYIFISLLVVFMILLLVLWGKASRKASKIKKDKLKTNLGESDE